jgi:hypothetical protein
VQVVGQVDGPHRKDGIAGQAHEQQPLGAGGRQGPGVWLCRGGEPGKGLGWGHGFSQGSRPFSGWDANKLVAWSVGSPQRQGKVATKLENKLNL